MTPIVRMRFGSHLYGTDTPASDLDFKSVFIPPAREILLQRVKGSVSTKRPKLEGERNVAGEVDEEGYSLQRYLMLAAEGQTVALDMLFAPESAMVSPPASWWREIQANKGRLLTRRHAAFVGYCRQQANKYGIKGSRVAAARAALAVLGDGVDRLGTVAKLVEMSDELRAFVAGREHASVMAIEVPGRVVDHLEVCGRKMPFTATIKSARDVAQRLVDEYGKRALQAEQQQGVDWKALSHAVRVGTQALELLATGNVTFPLPNRAHILEIKLGGLPYRQVAEEIEGLLATIEAEAPRSNLPDDADLAWIEDVICRAYRAECQGAQP